MGLNGSDLFVVDNPKTAACTLIPSADARRADAQELPRDALAPGKLPSPDLAPLSCRTFRDPPGGRAPGVHHRAVTGRADILGQPRVALEPGPVAHRVDPLG